LGSGKMRTRLLLPAAIVGLALGLGAAPVAAGGGSDRDHDGVPDQSDACPATPGDGTINGCPLLRVSLDAGWTFHPHTLQIDSLTVTATPRTQVDITCSGSCPFKTVSLTGNGRVQPVPGFQGVQVSFGTRLELRATRDQSIGVDEVRVAGRHGLSFAHGCLEPGTATPKAHCTGTGSSGPTPDDTDGDAVPNATDLCPALHGDGMATGCPPTDVATVFRGFLHAGGSRLSQLAVITGTAGAHADAVCSRSTTCPRHVSRTTRSGMTALPGYAGLLVPPGTLIELRVTRPGSIGSYTRFTARRSGLLGLTQRCMNPGSVIPRAVCNGTPVSEPPPPPPTPWLDPFPFVALKSAPLGNRRAFQKVTVESMPAGARIDVTCRGGGCPFGHRRNVRAPRGVIPGFGNKAALASGSHVTVRITKPHKVGLYVDFRAHGSSDPVRTEACLLPGSSTPHVCPVRP
jgi:hypothetical protein